MSYSRVSYITVNRTFFNIGYTATSYTKLYIKFKPHTGGSGNLDSTNTYIFGRGYTGQLNQFSINCYYASRSTTETSFRFRYYCGNSYNDNFILNCPTEEIYEGTLSSTGVSINGGGKSSATTFSSTFTSSPIYLLGGTDGGNGCAGVVTLYEASIYENNVLVRHYIPYKDNETGYGVVYEEITGTYLNGVAPSDVIAGDTLFIIEPDYISFANSGGSSDITINSDNSWTASTTNNWITISPSTGTSAVTSTTVTASSSLFSERNGTVTFTDGENTAELTVSQVAYNKAPFNNLFRNGNRIN